MDRELPKKGCPRHRFPLHPLRGLPSRPRAPPGARDARGRRRRPRGRRRRRRVLRPCPSASATRPPCDLNLPTPLPPPPPEMDVRKLSSTLGRAVVSVLAAALVASLAAASPAAAAVRPHPFGKAREGSPRPPHPSLDEAAASRRDLVECSANRAPLRLHLDYSFLDSASSVLSAAQTAHIKSFVGPMASERRGGPARVPRRRVSSRVRRRAGGAPASSLAAPAPHPFPPSPPQSSAALEQYLDVIGPTEGPLLLEIEDGFEYIWDLNEVCGDGCSADDDAYAYNRAPHLFGLPSDRAPITDADVVVFVVGGTADTCGEGTLAYAYTIAYKSSPSGVNYGGRPRVGGGERGPEGGVDYGGRRGRGVRGRSETASASRLARRPRALPHTPRPAGSPSGYSSALGPPMRPGGSRLRPSSTTDTNRSTSTR